MSTRPLIFANTVADLDQDTSPPSASPEVRTDNGVVYAPLDDNVYPADVPATALPPYEDNPSYVTRPQQTKRRTTGISMRSTASTLWSKTRDSVSHFNVPRIAAPWEHEIFEKDELNTGDSNTVRDFDYRRQRRRLFINSFFQWAITAAICLALVGVLYSYSSFLTLSQKQKHAFNALVTGLSILLGLNLASSLSGYAQMMRWRLLAAKYRNLQDFELIMNSDSQMKVVRLLWAGRTRGRWWIPNKTQVLCFSWLFINTALQVFTALLGLTYSVDTSSAWVDQQFGLVSIADMSYIHNIGYNETDFLDQAGAANNFGIEGQSYNPYVDIAPADQTYTEAYYTTSARESYWYRFIDQSPYDSTETEVSQRTVSTTATCTSYEVLSGGFGNDDPYVVYYDPQSGQNVSQYVYPTAWGCATWMADSQQTCGPRCTKVQVLLTADNQTGSVPQPRFFSCNNTVGQVSNLDVYWGYSSYMIANEQARLWAGAIGFSGFSNGDPMEYVRYEYASDWSPAGDSDNATMAELLMAFTAGALAANDVNGPRVNVTGYYPVQAQVVDVDWKWTIALLAGIPGCQFLVLLAVLAWANKVIIKDTSHLATARLLRPVVEKLGDKGCLLTGDEIAETLGNYRLKYGVRDPPQDSMAYSGLGGDFIRHVDVIEEIEGLGRADARMVNGLYDGTSTWDLDEDEREPLLRRRSTRRLGI